MASTEGLEEGSTCLVFSPTRPPADFPNRHVTIAAPSAAASTSLIFQAVLPFLIFASGPDTDNQGAPLPIHLQLTGGSNVDFSPSFDYLDQVLLPALHHRYGINIQGELLRRGWSRSTNRGTVKFTIHPLKRGEKLQPRQTRHELAQLGLAPQITRIDVSIVVPGHIQVELQDSLAADVSDAVPGADLNFKLIEDSGHDSRVYVLLVAHSSDGALRWGRDVLSSIPKKGRGKDNYIKTLTASLARDLRTEVFREGGTTGDKYLQDQLVVFQALAEGESTFFRYGAEDGSYQDDQDRMRQEKTHEPFGQGSLHAQTARWVAAEMMPDVKFFNKGTLCRGVGFS